MQHVAILVLGLALCGPLLVYSKKVVLVVPRHLRRSHQSLSYHGIPTRGRKSFYGSNKFTKSPNSGPFHPGKALNYGKETFPHEGDDFDQGSTDVNNVYIPHGAGIRYGISFGKGYIPHEEISGLLPSGPDHDKFNLEVEGSEYQDFESREEFGMKPPLPNIHSGFSDYGPSGSYTAESSDMYLPEQDEAGDFEIQERSRVSPSKLSNVKLPHYSSDGSTKNEVVSRKVHAMYVSPGNRNSRQLFTPSELATTSEGDTSAQASIDRPSSALLDGGKQGYVLTDSLSLDDYNAKVRALTENWPVGPGIASFGRGLGSSWSGNSFLSNNQPVVPTNQFFNSGLLPSTGVQTASPWLNMVPQQGKGYAVKEEMVEEPGHDFRTMPLPSGPVQSLSIPMNFGLPSFPQVLHG